MEHFLQGNVPLRHQLNSKLLDDGDLPSINDVNDLTISEVLYILHYILLVYTDTDTVSVRIPY